MSAPIVERLRAKLPDVSSAVWYKRDEQLFAEAADTIDALLAAAEKWRDLALKAVDCVNDAERETNWGQPLFGPSCWERLRDEQNELLHQDAIAKARS